MAGHLGRVFQSYRYTQLNSYKLSGDLLKALHVSREDGGIFQFRSQFEIIEENEKIFCVDEKRALKDFLYFLDRYPNSILIGVDENSISVLVRKLKYLNFGMFQRLVKGFSHLKIIL